MRPLQSILCNTHRSWTRKWLMLPYVLKGTEQSDVEVARRASQHLETIVVAAGSIRGIHPLLN